MEDGQKVKEVMKYLPRHYDHFIKVKYVRYRAAMMRQRHESFAHFIMVENYVK